MHTYHHQYNRIQNNIYLHVSVNMFPQMSTDMIMNMTMNMNMSIDPMRISFGNKDAAWTNKRLDQKANTSGCTAIILMVMIITRRQAM